MFPLFCKFRKEDVLYPNELCIYKHVSDGNFGFLPVVCNASAAYTRLCKGLKYLLKVRYIILNYPDFDFRDSLFGKGKNIDLCLKNNIKNKLTAFVYGKT